MTKAKQLFQQTVLISAAILFGIGIQKLTEKVLGGDSVIVWQWYIPFSIVLTGFLCSLPTLLLLDQERPGRGEFLFRLALQFLSTGGVVSLCGYFFGWYDSWRSYLPIAVMYVLIYGFVWAAMLWLNKKDEKKINEALKEIQDRE